MWCLLGRGARELTKENKVVQDKKLKDIHDQFIQKFAETAQEQGLSDEKIGTAFEDAFGIAVSDFAESLFADLKDRSAEMLAEHRELEEGFKSRNIERWREGLSHLRSMIVVSQETGEAAISGMLENDDLKESPKLHAIITLHARALRISREIICLIENGFADGALARWRSLHEIAVISHFLFTAKEEIAERYLLSRAILSYKAARQYVEHQDKAGLQPFGEEELANLKVHSEHIIEKYGAEMKNEYGWAFGEIGIEKPTFYHIEKHCGLDHWRPRVKWASQEIHGGFVPSEVGLGVSENTESVHLVGQSNSGMADPGNCCAISLQIATASLLLIEPNLDRLAVIQVMDLFCDEIGAKFQLGEAKEL